MRFSRWLSSGFALLMLAVAAPGANYLDGQGRLAWSPDGKWVVFNWPLNNELFAVAVDTPRAYLLKPVGDFDPDSAFVVSAEAPIAAIERGKRREAVTTPSPGFGKLTFEQWAPDSRRFLYRYGKGQRALFAVGEGRVSKKLAATELPPWTAADEWRVEFEHVRAATNDPARLLLRVRQGMGELVKEVVFIDPVEVAQLSNMRFRDVSFLAHHRQFLLYPRYDTNGWTLVRDPVRTREAPRPVIPRQTEPPYEWELSADDEFLAVTDRHSVTLGPVADWTQARKFPLATISVTIEWSPAGDLLAYQGKQLLHVVARAGGEARQVADYCAPQFWGWRGDRLLFGHARASRANVFEVPPAAPAARQILAAHKWQASPREMSVSPDGQRLACLVRQFDGNSIGYWELWVAPLARDAKWELVFAWRS